MEDRTNRPEKNRIVYIDSMRGLAMLLVVYSHIVFYWLGGESAVNDVFVKLSMPVFFFISGFVSYTANADGAQLKSKLCSRFFELFLPAIVVMLLFCAVYGMNIRQGLFENMKYGYWFTIVLFFVSVVQMAMQYLFQHRLSERMMTMSYLLVSVLSVFLCAVTLVLQFDKIPAYNLFSVRQVLWFLPFYLFGVISKMHEETFRKLIGNRFVILLSLLIFVVGNFFDFKGIDFLCGFWGVTIVWSLFYHCRKLFGKGNTVGRSLSYIGRNTIEIYFLHYFIVWGLRNCGFVEYGALIGNPAVELVVVSAVSLILTGICLAAAWVIRRIPLAGQLLFGFKKGEFARPFKKRNPK